MPYIGGNSNRFTQNVCSRPNYITMSDAIKKPQISSGEVSTYQGGIGSVKIDVPTKTDAKVWNPEMGRYEARPSFPEPPFDKTQVESKIPYHKAVEKATAKKESAAVAPRESDKPPKLFNE